MNAINRILGFAAVTLVIVAGVANGVLAQQGRYANVYSRNDVRGFVDKLDRSSSAFRRDFDRYLDRSPINGTPQEDQYNADVRAYEQSLRNLKRQLDRNEAWWQQRSYAQDMVSRAQAVNSIMMQEYFARNLERQWRDMRNDINKVADTYDLPGVAGGGWTGGGGWNGNGGGGWNGGGQAINPPSWAVGTFYGTDPMGRRVTVTISRDGYVNANTNGTPFTGRFVRGNYLSFEDGTSQVIRDGDGFRTVRSSNGETTYFSRNGYGNGGGGWNGGGVGTGVKVRPPSWAIGTFTGMDPSAVRVTVTISGDGTISAEANGTPFYGSYVKGDYFEIANGRSKVTRSGNGFTTEELGTGKRIYYTRQ
jgi:hypothetical protein